MSLVLL